MQTAPYRAALVRCLREMAAPELHAIPSTGPAATLRLWAWLGAVGFSAAVVIWSSVILHAQSQEDWTRHERDDVRQSERLRAVTEDVASLKAAHEKADAERHTQAMMLETRLTRLETYNETNRWLLLAVITLVAPVGLNAALSLISARRKRGNGHEAQNGN